MTFFHDRSFASSRVNSASPRVFSGSGLRQITWIGPSTPCTARHTRFMTGSPSRYGFELTTVDAQPCLASSIPKSSRPSCSPPSTTMASARSSGSLGAFRKSRYPLIHMSTSTITTTTITTSIAVSSRLRVDMPRRLSGTEFEVARPHSISHGAHARRVVVAVVLAVDATPLPSDEGRSGAAVRGVRVNGVDDRIVLATEFHLFGHHLAKDEWHVVSVPASQIVDHGIELGPIGRPRGQRDIRFALVPQDGGDSAARVGSQNRVDGPNAVAVEVHPGLGGSGIPGVAVLGRKCRVPARAGHQQHEPFRLVGQQFCE